MFCTREGIVVSAFSQIMAKGLNAFTQAFLAQQQRPILTYEKKLCLFFLEKISCSKLTGELRFVKHPKNTLCTSAKIIMCMVKPQGGGHSQNKGVK
jgi:hypothetical protein